MSEAESKARPHGAMPQQLRDYFIHGQGAAEIGWGAPDDYYRCLTVVGRHVPAHEVHGLCENLHEIATGMSTADHEKLLKAKGKAHPTSAGEAVAAKTHGKS